MLPCNECHRSGLATCPECEGLGYLRQVRDSGEIESHACAECRGKKWSRCDACGGIGWLGADNAAVLPAECGFEAEDWLTGARDDGCLEPAAIERLVSGDW